MNRRIDRGLDAVVLLQVVAKRAAQRGVDLDSHQVARRAIDLLVAVDQLEALDVREQLAVAMNELAATFDLAVKPLKARLDERCANVVTPLGRA